MTTMREALEAARPYIAARAMHEFFSEGSRTDFDDILAKIDAALSAPAPVVGEEEIARIDSYVIRKNGYFYRPGAHGYTSSIFEAGRWTKEEADKRADGCAGVTVHTFNEFFDEEARELHRKFYMIAVTVSGDQPTSDEIATRCAGEMLSGPTPRPALDPGRKHLFDFTDAEINMEKHRRDMAKLGDQSVGVTLECMPEFGISAEERTRLALDEQDARQRAERGVSAGSPYQQLASTGEKP